MTARGPILPAAAASLDGWNRRATVIAIFNPKGGVGKTTVATNLAATLQIRRHRKGKSVLLIDADTVTGHVTTSLGIDAVRTVADSWRDEARRAARWRPSRRSPRPLDRVRVIALTDSPLDTEILDPDRVAMEIQAARGRFDVIVVDLHPSYSALNQAIFEDADRILVPVTPDVPAIRAAVQLRDVATGSGCRERLAMVVNRANSGVTVADMERTVGMPALALIRSGGLLFVRAANEGRTVIEMFPKETDRQRLRRTGRSPCSGSPPAPVAASRPGLRLFARQKEADQRLIVAAVTSRTASGPASSGRAPAQRRPRVRRDPRYRIDLAHPAQVGPVHQDGPDAAGVERPITELQRGTDDRTRTCRSTDPAGAPGPNPGRGDGPDDVEGRCLEGHHVVDLCGPVRGALVLAHRRAGSSRPRSR